MALIQVGRFPDGVGLSRALRDDATKQAVLRVASLWVAGQQKMAFSHGGHHTRGGKRWAPLSAATIRAKGSSAILIDRGFLRQSVGGTYNPQGGTIIYANASYAPYHQSGRGVPRRRVIHITASDRVGHAKRVKDWLGRALNGSR